MNAGPSYRVKNTFIDANPEDEEDEMGVGAAGARLP